MQEIDQSTATRPKTVSEASRPTSRWSSSRFSTSMESNNLATPVLAARRRLLRPTRTSQQTYAHMNKTKHEMEEIFKFYYSTNSKLDHFKETVTGTRVNNSPQTTSPPPSHNPFTETSSDVFRVRHCVSREDMGLPDRQGNEYQSVLEQLNKTARYRPAPLENDESPMIIQSIKLRPPFTLDPSLTSKNLSSTRPDESPLVKLAAYSHDISTHSPEQKEIQRHASTASGHRPKSSATSTSIPAAVYTLASDRRDPINLSPLSTSTSNSSQEQRQPHILTGTAMTTHQRPPTRSARHNQRGKSNVSKPTYFSSEPPTVKTSPYLFESDVSEPPAHIVTQSVASIPSKSSRYVLITFPKARSRYHIPTSVERLLLPERFPVLFQNILHSSDPNQNNK